MLTTHMASGGAKAHSRAAPPRPTVIYRPGNAIGIGHLLYSWAGYATLARRIGADFLTTLSGTVFDLFPGGEARFAERFFEPAPGSRDRFSLDCAAVARRLDPQACQGQKRLVLGRSDRAQRAAGEFPALLGADFTDRLAKPGDLNLQRMRQYDVIYADSVVPKDNMEAAFGPFRSPLQFSSLLRGRAAGLAPSPRYVGVHLRHGNGETLSGRTGGTDPGFRSLAGAIAAAAREAAAKTGAQSILCFSDNAGTARHLAELTGGHPAGTGFLPDLPFQAFLRGAPGQEEDRISKILLDLAALSGACCIVAASSLFAKAAQQMAPETPLAIVPGPVPGYRGFRQ